MDTTQTNYKLIPIYKIKESNSRLIHLCLTDNNLLFVLFSKKNGFNEFFSTDINNLFIEYNCIVNEKNNNYSLENASLLLS